MTVGTPISTQGMTQADVERLKGLAREQILALRASLLPLTSAGQGGEEGARAA